MKVKVNKPKKPEQPESSDDDFVPAWPAKVPPAHDAHDDTGEAVPPAPVSQGTSRAQREEARAEVRQAPARSASTKAGEPRPLHRDELDRLAGLGIFPESLAGRLRLVLTIGCYRDFRFTRDILLTGSARDQVDRAIDALRELGASCDCQVLQAVGQQPRGLLWHHPTTKPRR
jgi:hypothetical protein